MKAEDIINGTLLTTCRHELTAHMEALENALINNECDFGEGDWKLISRGIDDKSREFNQCIHH
jgi:hypothetical protein